jgi:hypothetical protein
MKNIFLIRGRGLRDDLPVSLSNSSLIPFYYMKIAPLKQRGDEMV